MDDSNKRLGIIAGSGDLPVLLSKISLNPYIVGIKGFCNQDHYDIEISMFSLVKIGAIVKTLKGAGVSEIVIAGGIKRPALSKLMPDVLGAKLISRLAMAGGGDDKALRTVVEFLQEQGFVVKSVEDILGPQTANKGVMGTVKPNTIHLSDIERGREILQATSALDIGQGVIIQEDLVLTIETIEGTDKMIKRISDVIRYGNSPVLIKMIKLEQSRTVDLPTIGVNTIKIMHANGLGGIAISASGVIILDRDAVVETANTLGLFIVAI